MSSRPVRLTAIAAALALLLTACVFAPGRFSSTLDVRRDGTFAFTYIGEIHMLPLSELARRGEQSEPFAPTPCYDDRTGNERKCSNAEITEQRANWEQNRKDIESRKQQDTEMAKAALGGIDPEDPKAAEEIAARLRKQAGWKRVDYKGHGLFDVEFALNGRLDHDFAFPTIERFPTSNPFVTLSVRNDGTLRMDAPGYGAFGAGTPFAGLGPLAAMQPTKKDVPGWPQIDGQFTVTTDGEVLSNNTADGPVASGKSQRLFWRVVGNASDSAPMALIRLR